MQQGTSLDAMASSVAVGIDSMSKIRVVLTDDQPIVCRGISLLLQEDPNIEIVGEAADGWQAVEGAQRLLPDVVLMDIDMPGMSGLEAAGRITQSVPGASVLMLTIHDREDFLFQALQAGALGYILKAADVDELLTAVRTVHSGEVFVYPRMASKLVGEYLRTTRGDADGDGYSVLSVREKEVLPMLAENHSNQEIADILHLSPFTVQTYRQRIMRKLDLHSRIDLLKYALRKRLISLD